MTTPGLPDPPASTPEPALPAATVPVHEIRRPSDLSRAVIASLARSRCRIVLAPGLLDDLAASRRAALGDLAGDRPVYGVNTGMGAMAGVRLDAAAQARQQNTLMIGRAVGSAPWLRHDEARALLAARLRTLLHPAAGVSPSLCEFLVALLDAHVVPAIPLRGGAAGEIIPLAHAGAVLIGAGQVLTPPGAVVDAAPTGTDAAQAPADAAPTPASPASTPANPASTPANPASTRADAASTPADAASTLAAAGLAPRPFEAKEGVAFLEGVPGLTGLAALAAEDTRTLLQQILVASAASHAVIRASRDPLHPDLADSEELRTVLTTMRDLLGAENAQQLIMDDLARGAAREIVDEELPQAAREDIDGELPRAHAGGGPARQLQAPVSFRVTAPALTVALRAVAGLEAAADRGLDAVTDSPAHLDGRFVGTFGFAGTDLAATAGALTTALVHLAELGAARLHRLLDSGITGLPRQLSDAPGLHAGMVTVHKRAVGVVHRLRRFVTPALVGAMETSLGQEDVQSFGFEAAECLGEAVAGLRDVLACELLAVHQARLLGGPPEGLTGRGTAALDEIAAALPAGTADRPFGRDLDRIADLLENGWATTERAR
ncbi:aromatic amino acid lyase [Actinoplanes sp. NPDC051513]|uniref:aromatic amino acid lyase n=1 Tax=Actinoplanes sp. NPDC051513 TaxID=3363908 RepID=UPI00379564B4